MQNCGEAKKKISIINDIYTREQEKFRCNKSEVSSITDKSKKDKREVHVDKRSKSCCWDR
jgi:hypothetical protein